MFYIKILKNVLIEMYLNNIVLSEENKKYIEKYICNKEKFKNELKNNSEKKYKTEQRKQQRKTKTEKYSIIKNKINKNIEITLSEKIFFEKIKNKNQQNIKKLKERQNNEKNLIEFHKKIDCCGGDEETILENNTSDFFIVKTNSILLKNTTIKYFECDCDKINKKENNIKWNNYFNEYNIDNEQQIENNIFELLSDVKTIKK